MKTARSGAVIVACKKTDKGQTGAARVSQAQQPPEGVQGAVNVSGGQTSLVKTKQRVADHGEVFTPAWMV